MSQKYSLFVRGEIWKHPVTFESRWKELSRHFCSATKEKEFDDSIEVDGFNENEIQFAAATLALGANCDKNELMAWQAPRENVTVKILASSGMGPQNIFFTQLEKFCL